MVMKLHSLQFFCRQGLACKDTIPDRPHCLGIIGVGIDFTHVALQGRVTHLFPELDLKVGSLLTCLQSVRYS